MGNDRRQHILKLLEQTGEVQLAKLKEIFPSVSLMTLRRDLISLEEGGYLIRTYGGAVIARKAEGTQGEEDTYSRRALENVEAKLIIADKALEMVEIGRSTYFDAGSTIMCLAKSLPDDGFSIVTSGVNIALELSKKQRVSVMLPGGTINKNTLSVSGPGAAALIDSVNIDTAFMAASGFSIDGGFTVSNVYEGDLKHKIVKKAKKVVMLMDAGKLGRSLAFTFATLEDVDVWVCEKALPPEVEAAARNNGVVIV